MWQLGCGVNHTTAVGTLLLSSELRRFHVPERITNNPLLSSPLRPQASPPSISLPLSSSALHRLHLWVRVIGENQSIPLTAAPFFSIGPLKGCDSLLPFECFFCLTVLRPPTTTTAAAAARLSCLFVVLLAGSPSLLNHHLPTNPANNDILYRFHPSVVTHLDAATATFPLPHAP